MVEHVTGRARGRLTRGSWRTAKLGLVVALLLSTAGVVNGREAASAATNGPQSFTNAKVADVASKYVGQSRPTGWDMPGECIKWVQSWIAEAGGRMAGGGPITAYKNSPATQVPTSQIQKGDIGQISRGDTYDGSPHTWVFASGKHADGTYDIIEGNVPYGSGKVRKIRRKITVPTGHEYRVWRFGRAAASSTPTTPSTPSVAKYAGHLVQWRDEKPNVVTTWLVGPDLRRTWVPDGGTYNWMRAAGAKGPVRLTSAELNALPDRKGVHARTNQLGVNWSAKRGTVVRSTKGGYRLAMQSDGNLVIYNSKNQPLWASRTVGRATNLVMQADGNLVLYNGATPVWSSGTAGRGRSRLVMQDDGNLVVMAANGRATWNSETWNGQNRLSNPAGRRL